MLAGNDQNQMKNYSVIPIDPNASLFQDSSVVQIQSTENLPKEILDDFIQNQRPVGLLALKKKYSSFGLRVETLAWTTATHKSRL
ncbi:MAG: hypothetical protein HQK59_05340 [Deltaproteobacteria bacterium]|nr:hypothetical protein [Deltaproteobacteria bacterium]